MREIVLIGVGADAKAVIAAATRAGLQVRAAFDDQKSRFGNSILGVPIVGPLCEAGHAGLPGVLGVTDPLERKRAVELLDISWETIVHPQAFVHPSSVLGPGTVILEGAVVQPNVTIGRHVLIGANATVSHDCIIQDFACLGPGVDLAGTVRVGEGACFQVGSLVMPNIRIGKWATIGPRSAVIRDVPDRIAVDGTPARPANDPPRAAGGSYPIVPPIVALLMGSFFTALGAGIARRSAHVTQLRRVD
jgi:sugar O-acyltransferase (sialic acid O-acetyltransferase NeuD family)